MLGGMTCRNMAKHKNGHQKEGFDWRLSLFRKFIRFFLRSLWRNHISSTVWSLHTITVKLIFSN